MKQFLKQSQTFNVLCSLAQARLNAGGEGDIEHVLDRQIDWVAVLQLARMHRIHSLVYHVLLKLGSRHVPGEFIRQMHQKYQKDAIHNLFLVKELGRLLEIFETHQIKALALKGPVLAQLAYSDLNLRSYMDMDILIDAKNYNNVRDLLRKEGYSMHPGLGGFNRMREKMYVLQNGQFPFTKGALTYRLDLHTRVMPPLMQRNMPFDVLWGRSKHISIAGTRMRTFEPEDMLLVLCFQGFKDRWEKLKYICDVTAFVSTKPDLRWDVIFERALHMKSMRTLMLGLRLAKTLLNAPLPSSVSRVIDHAEGLDEITEQVIARLTQREQNDTMKFHERIHFYMTIQDTYWARFKYVTHALLRRAESVLPRVEWGNVRIR